MWKKVSSEKFQKSVIFFDLNIAVMFDNDAGGWNVGPAAGIIIFYSFILFLIDMVGMSAENNIYSFASPVVYCA